MTCGCCGRAQVGWYDRKVRRVRDLSCGDARIFLELEVRRLDCRHCGKVKRELLDFLADNPLYTPSTLPPGPRVIGIDEIAIREGHTYRIVVSDLPRGRPIGLAVRTGRRRAWGSSMPG
jgi:transposase